jgi:hypothetical protein
MGQPMTRRPERLTFESIVSLMRPPAETGRRSIVSHRRQAPAGQSGPVTIIKMTPAEAEARAADLEAERLARR